jgi:hypothetical protein
MFTIFVITLGVAFWFVLLGKSIERFDCYGGLDLRAWAMFLPALLIFSWVMNETVEHREERQTAVVCEAVGV